MKKAIIALLVSLILVTTAVFASIEDQSDVPADYGADDASGLDVVNYDTDSADESTDVADVYPAGSENSVIVDKP